MSDDEVSPEVLTKAKNYGWWPKDKYRGDPDKWVDAQSFVDRAEQILPVVKKDRERLEHEVSRLNGELQKTQNLLTASAEAIEELKNFNSAANKKVTEGKKSELISAIAAASRDGEHEKAAELTDQLTEVNLALREAKKAPPATAPLKTTNGVTDLDPEQNKLWQEWSKDKDWMKDPMKLGAANGIAAKLRNDPANSSLTGEPFWNAVEEEVNRVFGGNSRREAPAKTEGGSRGTGETGGGSGHSFADLPAEAKAACDRSSKRVVGEGRAFKTMKEYQKWYAENFSWE